MDRLVARCDSLPGPAAAVQQCCKHMYVWVKVVRRIVLLTWTSAGPAAAPTTPAASPAALAAAKAAAAAIWAAVAAPELALPSAALGLPT